MKLIVVKPSKPRNPLVAPCLGRKAGSHRRRNGALRQRAETSLRRELDSLGKPSR